LIIIAAKNFVQMPDHPARTHGPGKKPNVYPKDVMEYLRTPLGRKYPNSDLNRGKAAENTKLQEHRFAPAIKASGCPILHYDEDRCITIREAAALQSFPYDYEFLGTIAEQQRQVGNAVPVEMSRAIAKAVRESIRLHYAEEFETNDSVMEEELSNKPTDSVMEEELPNKPDEEQAEGEYRPETIIGALISDSFDGSLEDGEVVEEGHEIRGIEESKEEVIEMRDGRQKRPLINNISECKEELE
jgi:C-5 cytosine-specific DNA methylase